MFGTHTWACTLNPEHGFGIAPRPFWTRPDAAQLAGVSAGLEGRIVANRIRAAVEVKMSAEIEALAAACNTAQREAQLMKDKARKLQTRLHHAREFASMVRSALG